jgi:hypothetical protein
VTRLGWRLKRLEEVMAPANEEPIRIKVAYVDVSGETAGGYEVVVPPRPRIGFCAGRTRGDGFPTCQMSSGVLR